MTSMDMSSLCYFTNISLQFASGMTVMNEYDMSPIFSIVTTYLTLVAVGTFTFRRAKGNIYNVLP